MKKLGAALAVTIVVLLALLSRQWPRARDAAPQPPQRVAGSSSSALAWQPVAPQLPRTELAARAAPARAARVNAAPLPASGVELSGRVLDVLGGPVIGAQVSARAVVAGERVGAVAISDALGGFRLSVSPGELDLLAQADAYSRSLLRVRAPARDVLLVLAPGGIIRGRVVASETQEPVADVPVTALQRGGVQGTPISARSGADGQFVLSELAGGTYELSALAARGRSEAVQVPLEVGAARSGVVLELEPATTLEGRISLAAEPCSSGSVTLTGAEGTRAFAAPDGHVRIEGLLPGEYGLEIECEGALALHEDLHVAADPLSRAWSLERGLAVEGRVESTLGRGLAGAAVSVEPVGEPAGRRSARCVSDEQGEFACAGLVPGQYACGLVGSDGNPRSERVDVSLEDRSQTILLVSDAAATIRAALDPAQNSSVGLRVFARRGAGAVFEATSAGEAFVLERLPLGDYELYASVSAVLEPGSPVVAARLERDEQVLELSLPRVATQEIAGRVLDEHGEPLLDAWVHLNNAGVLSERHDPAQSPAVTDDQGRFSLSGILPGSYDVRVESPTHTGYAERIPAGARDVVIRAQADAALALEVAAADGAPVTRFQLAYQRGDDWSNEVFVRGARWQLARLRPGSYRLELEAAGARAVERLSLAPGERRQLSVTVSAAPVSAERGAL